MPWPFWETEQQRLLRQEEIRRGHIERYRRDRDAAELREQQRRNWPHIQQEMAERISDEEWHEEAAARAEELRAQRDESPEAILAWHRRHCPELGITMDDLSQSVRQRASYVQAESQSDSRQANLHRPSDFARNANHNEPSPQNPGQPHNPYQQNLFHSSNPARQNADAARSNTWRAPAFREGWDQNPNQGIDRPPSYHTSEREDSRQRPPSSRRG